MRNWNGKKPVTEIAALLGVSVTNIKRSMKGERLWFRNNKYVNQPLLVRQVLDYYFEHGKTATVERFPNVNVKCIVDRPEYYGIERKYRQIRWTDREILEATRMAGLVSPTAQARYFNRPNACNGSIKSLWVKRFGLAQGQINGMTFYYAQHLVDSSAQFLKPRGEGRRGDPVLHRWIILWVDMEKCLLPDTPEFIRDAVKTMAQFQRWIWKSENPKPRILKMIQEREVV